MAPLARMLIKNSRGELPKTVQGEETRRIEYPRKIDAVGAAIIKAFDDGIGRVIQIATERAYHRRTGSQDEEAGLIELHQEIEATCAEMQKIFEDAAATANALD